MSVYLSPGVYPKEVDFSAYVQSLASSVTGMVVVAEKGPIGKVVETSNFPEWVSVFGGFLRGHYGAYAAKMFFDNGGGRLKTVRTAHYDDPSDVTSLTAKGASVVLKDGSDEDTLKITATPGTWANTYKAVVTEGEGGTFHLEIQDGRGNRVEFWKDLTMDPEDERYVERVVNASLHFTAEDLVTETADPTPKAGTFVFAGGNDGLAGLSDADYIGDEAAGTGLQALYDEEPLNLIIIPGVTSGAVHTAMIDFCERRLDVMAILETPAGLDVAEAIEYRKGGGSYTHSAFNTSYAAMYYPWLRIADPVSGEERIMPPSAAVAGKYAYNDQVGHVWTAPAGLNRGVLRNVLGTERKLNEGHRDALYEAGINPIADFTDGGVVIWGQKTLQAKASATDRVNVRRLLMHIESAVTAASRQLLFEPHNPATWNAFVRLVTPFLQEIQDRGGLYATSETGPGFHVICDATTNTPAVVDQGLMVAKIFVKPTRTSEMLEIQFSITGSGARFEELFAS